MVEPTYHSACIRSSSNAERTGKTLRISLSKICRPKLLSDTMPNVKHLDNLLFFEYTVYHTIDMGLVSIEQMPELAIFWCHRAATRIFCEGINRFFQAVVPASGSYRLRRALFLIEDFKIACRANCEFNEICHVSGESGQRRLSLDESARILRLPAPGGCPPPRQI